MGPWSIVLGFGLGMIAAAQLIDFLAVCPT